MNNVPPTNVPPPPKLGDVEMIKIVEPLETDVTEDYDIEKIALDPAVRDLESLVEVMSHRVEQIKKKYSELRSQLERDEKEEIAAFYSKVHMRMQKSNATWCPIS